MNTYATKLSDIKREQHVIDATNRPLGRLASQVAALLMGKHKVIFARNMDVGDVVTVFNAEKVQLTGKKIDWKVYYHHTGYPGGLKKTSLRTLMETYPTRVIEYAVKGMLPDNRLGARMIRRLKVIAGEAGVPRTEATVEKQAT